MLVSKSLDDQAFLNSVPGINGGLMHDCNTELDVKSPDVPSNGVLSGII